MRRLVTVDLWEVSLVTFPLMPGARVFRMPALPALDAKYSPDQPRVPKGEPGGGQWTADGTGTGRGKRDEDDEPRSTRGEGADAKPRSAKEPNAGRDRSDNQTRDSGGTRDLVDRREKIESLRDGDEKRSKDGGVEDAQHRRGAPPTGPGSGGQRRDEPNNPPIRGGRVDVNNPQDAVPNHAIPRHTHNSEAELQRRMASSVAAGRGVHQPLEYSTFESLARANDLVNRTLDAHRGKIASWRANDNDKLRLDHFPGEQTGLILHREAGAQSSDLVQGDGVRVVLVRDRRATRGWLILTTYVISRSGPRRRP